MTSGLLSEHEKLNGSFRSTLLLEGLVLKSVKHCWAFTPLLVVTVFLHFMEEAKSMLGMFGFSFLQLLKHFVSYPILQQVFLIPFYN